MAPEIGHEQVVFTNNHVELTLEDSVTVVSIAGTDLKNPGKGFVSTAHVPFINVHNGDSLQRYAVKIGADFKPGSTVEASGPDKDGVILLAGHGYGEENNGPVEAHLHLVFL